MWKRNASDQVAEPAPPPEATRPQTRATPNPGPPPAEPTRDPVAIIGPSVVIKGELNGSENLVIDGRVDGMINLRDHMLTIGPNGQIQAQVAAKSVVVVGKVDGNITAAKKVEIRENGSVEGDITSPSLAIAEGAHFRGSIDMQPSKAPKQDPTGKPQPGAKTGGTSGTGGTATGATGGAARVAASAAAASAGPPSPRR